jgi:hypothetical protein
MQEAGGRDIIFDRHKRLTSRFGPPRPKEVKIELALSGDRDRLATCL